MIEKRFICVCDWCRHIWIAEEEPERCAGCKSRTWNQGGGVSGPGREETALVPVVQPAVVAVEPEYIPEQTAEQAEKKRRKQVKEQRHAELRAECVANLPREMTPRMVEKVRQHDTKTCRAYKCFACEAAGVKDPHRGIGVKEKQ